MGCVRGSFGRSRAWGAAVAMAGLGLAATGAQAAEPASVMIVFDGSGSMWASIEGAPRTNKLTLARDAVRRALGKVDPQTRIGLAAFGHRRGDCGDVEVIRPPEPVDVQRLADSLDRFNPRGRGPLVAGLREAAKALGPPPAKRSIVLIHDDADNCQLNVCTMAEELKASGITAHVVGLAVKPDDAGRMACLPQLTRGRMINVQSAADVGPAIEEALRLAGAAPAMADRAPPKPTVTAALTVPGPAPIPADAPPGLYLRALLAPNTEALGTAVQWTVRADGKDGASIYAARAASPHVPVEPGRYLVEARDGAVFASMVVDAADKVPTAVNLVLNAGLLRVRGLVEKVGAPLGDAVITISEAGAASESRKDAPSGAPLALSKGGETVALLPAGRYVVRVEQGLVRAERSVVVPAGSQGRIDIPLNAARLQVSAATRDDAGMLDAPVFSVDEDDPDAPRGRREVARSTAKVADFVLPPGTYYVIARQGGAETRERLALAPGEVMRRSLTLASGRLALATKPPGTQGANEPVSYRIERLDASPPEVITTSRPAPTLMLAPGRYRVEGRYGAMNVRAVRDVEIRAGQPPQQLTLEPQAAAVRLRLVGGGSTPLADVFWDIRDEAGRTVWTTGLAEPAATLQVGRYVVRAETRDKRYERAVELRAGDTRVVELTAD